MATPNHTFTRGQRVKTPVSDGLRHDRWWSFGTVIEVDGPWVYVDRGGMTTVHPHYDLLHA